MRLSLSLEELLLLVRLLVVDDLELDVLPLVVRLLLPSAVACSLLALSEFVLTHHGSAVWVEAWVDGLDDVSLCVVDVLRHHALLASKVAAAAHLGVSEGVRALVRCQVGGLREALVAVGEGAHVRLLPSVRPQVSPQVKVKRELLIAYLTLVGLLSSVD